MYRFFQRDMEDIYSSGIDWSRFNNTTILITGAYGMIASYMVLFFYYLKEEKGLNIKLIAVGRSKDKFKAKYSMCDLVNKEWVQFIQHDLKCELRVDGPVDYIIHAASLASPQYYEICPVDVILPNTLGCYNVLTLAVEKKVKSFLLFSTGDIYGKVGGKSWISEDICGIVDTLDIHNCYSESKRLSETLCKAFWVQYNVPVRIARIWHTYAPTMDIENDPRVFASFVNNVVKGQNIEMKSDGSGKRSFCYITDAIEGYFRILLDGVSGEAYNVCNESQHMSVFELAEKLISLESHQLQVIHTKRKQDDSYSENILLKDVEAIPSSQKLQKLGWKPRVSVEEGFKRVIDYHKEIQKSL